MSELTQDATPSLYRNGAFHMDCWQVLEEGAEINDLDKVFVPFGQALPLLSGDVALPESFGVLVGPDDDVEALGPYLDSIKAVAVSFPSFADGRGFSSARLLRERLEFKGEIRAVGSYILDQMPFLERCGVDSFLISSPKVRAGLERGEWPEVTHYYQPTAKEAPASIASRPWLRRKVDQTS